MECRIIHPDGATHWVWLHGRAHPGPNGKPARATGVISDISGPKRIEESLRDQAQLLDLAHDAILSLDLDGTIRFWSRGAEALYGWRRDEVFGKNVHDLLKTVFPEDKPEIVRKADERGYW